MENKLTQLDPSQIVKVTFDEENQAQRVYLVNSNEIKALKSEEKPEALQLQRIEIPHIIKETTIERIEVPQILIQKEIKEIQIPVIIKELEIKEIEKQILIPSETQIQIVEKEIIYRWVKFFLPQSK